jgi:glycosyltransferase involved in cell wall biosynthesis
MASEVLRSNTANSRRPVIAFFDYPDVFEDFYPHYHVSQSTFATRWRASGNHAFLSLIQRDVGDVIWYAFSLKPELDQALHEFVGCKVKFVRSSWLHRQLWKLFYLPKPAWRWRFAYPWFAMVAAYLAPLSPGFLRELRKDRPDFFFLQDYSSGKFDVLSALARLFGVPLIAYHSGSPLDSYHGRPLRRRTLRWAHRIIASGGGELKMLASQFRVPRERLVVILTPINTEVYKPLDRETACRAVGLDPKRRYLLFVGRLDDGVKRVSSIIRAFARASDRDPRTDLIIVGDGEDREKLELIAAKLLAPGRVRFVGWVDAVETKARLYASAECLVLASWREGFPSVVGEAMACGTPVVSSRVGAVEELVINGATGWLYSSGDDEALASTLALIMSQQQLPASMREQARSLAESRVSPAAVLASLRMCFERDFTHGNDSDKTFATRA